MIDRHFAGVWPTMVTPFDERLNIDYDGVAALVDWYLENRVDGIFALCQSSEMFFLSPEEGLALVRFVLKRVDGRVPVVVSGHTAEDMDTQADDLTRLAAEGPNAVILLTNRFFKQGEAENGNWLERLDALADRLGDIPLGIYECPYPYPRLVSPSEIAHIAKGGRFVFFKDTCCDYDLFAAKLNAARGSALSMLNANTAILLDTLRAGADGFCGVMGNIHPLLYHHLDRNWKDGPADKVERLSDFLALASVIETRLYPVCAKYYLSLLGLPINTYTRSKDHTLFTQANAAEMRALLRMTREMERDWQS